MKNIAKKLTAMRATFDEIRNSLEEIVPSNYSG